MEWGCMQALIDFDGWRKWKDFSATEEAQLASSEAPSKKSGGALGGKGKSKKSRLSANRESVAQSATIKEENEEGKQ